MDPITPAALLSECNLLNESDIFHLCETLLREAFGQKEDAEELWTLTAGAVTQCIDDLTEQGRFDEPRLLKWTRIVEKDYGGIAELQKQKCAADVLRERREVEDREIECNWGVRYGAFLGPEYLESGKPPSRHLLAALARLSACCPYDTAVQALKDQIERRLALPYSRRRGKSAKRVVTVSDVRAVIEEIDVGNSNEQEGPTARKENIESVPDKPRRGKQKRRRVGDHTYHSRHSPIKISRTASTSASPGALSPDVEDSNDMAAKPKYPRLSTGSNLLNRYKRQSSQDSRADLPDKENLIENQPVVPASCRTPSPTTPYGDSSPHQSSQEENGSYQEREEGRKVCTPTSQMQVALKSTVTVLRHGQRQKVLKHTAVNQSVLAKVHDSTPEKFRTHVRVKDDMSPLGHSLLLGPDQDPKDEQHSLQKQMFMIDERYMESHILDGQSNDSPFACRSGESESVRRSSNRDPNDSPALILNGSRMGIEHGRAPKSSLSRFATKSSLDIGSPCHKFFNVEQRAESDIDRPCLEQADYGDGLAPCPKLLSLDLIKADASTPVSQKDFQPNAPSRIRAFENHISTKTNVMRLGDSEATRPIQTPPNDLQGALESLQDGQWLSSTAIELALKCCPIPHVRCVDSSYFDLHNPGLVHKKTPLRLAETRLVIMPLHYNNVHWTLATINTDRHTISYYDSMRSGDIEDTVKEALAQLGIFLSDDAMLERTTWVIEKKACPLQGASTVDCGVFTLATALYTIVDQPLPQEYDAWLWRMIWQICLSCSSLEHNPAHTLRRPQAIQEPPFRPLHDLSSTFDTSSIGELTANQWRRFNATLESAAYENRSALGEAKRSMRLVEETSVVVRQTCHLLQEAIGNLPLPNKAEPYHRLLETYDRIGDGFDYLREPLSRSVKEATKADAQREQQFAALTRGLRGFQAGEQLCNEELAHRTSVHQQLQEDEKVVAEKIKLLTQTYQALLAKSKEIEESLIVS